MHCRVGDHVMDKELIYEKLPADIADRHVLLMDPILATGNSAVKAIQVSSSCYCGCNIKLCDGIMIYPDDAGY
jgi:uracil phosphoribosyltransferase